MGRKPIFTEFRIDPVVTHSFQDYQGNLFILTELTGVSKADSIREAIKFYIRYLQEQERLNPRPKYQDETPPPA